MDPSVLAGVLFGILALLCVVGLVLRWVFRQHKQKCLPKSQDVEVEMLVNLSKQPSLPPLICYESIIQLLGSDNHRVLSVVCEKMDISDSEKVVPPIVAILWSKNRWESFFGEILRAEVASTASVNSLLRANSVVTRFVKALLFGCCRPYLQKTFGALQAHICSEELSYEVDASRALNGDEVTASRNAERLSELCAKFVEAIVGSIPHTSQVIRRLFRAVREIVAERFPESLTTSVGGLFLLRFVNPSITLPHRFGLVDAPPSKTVSRTLLLVSKVLQGLASGIAFGTKEEYMRPFNAFIEAHTPAVNRFLDALTEESQFHPCVVEDDPIALVPSELESLRNHLRMRLPALVAALGPQDGECLEAALQDFDRANRRSSYGCDINDDAIDDGSSE